MIPIICAWCLLIASSLGDYDNRYPIHLAAAEGEVVSVHFLTYAHADVSLADRWG